MYARKYGKYVIIFSNSAHSSSFLTFLFITHCGVRWTTYMNTDATGGPPLTYGQQSTEASSENNSGQGMGKRQ